MRTAAVVIVLAAAAAACEHYERGADKPAPARRLGDAMIEVGMRFERSGRAVLAARWELAGYDIAELGEVFDRDLFASKWSGNADVARLAHEFDAMTLPALRDAVRAKDRAGCESAFTRAAHACNACHVAAGMGFIEISGSLGASVPTVDAPAAR